MSAVPISGTKELASRTPGIVWHTRSDTFVLIPLLELTRAVAQTVPVFFLTLPFVGGLHQCRGWVCQPETAVCVIPTERSDEESQPLF